MVRDSVNSILRLGLLSYQLYFVIFLIFLFLSCSESLPYHSQFSVGMTRDAVLGKFGKPLRTQVMTKSGEGIMGAIEDYWNKIPMGAKVEIWAYDSVNIMESPDGDYKQAGQTELYFVNDSNKVNGIGFNIEGAVYEKKVELPIF